MKKTRVLFICTHNSARSQMAEGLLNALYCDSYEAMSAGTEPSAIRPEAVKVMAEIGIDISSHRLKHAREFVGQAIDIVVTVCDKAKEACPFFPGAQRYIHKSFSDPAACRGTEEEILACFRRIRDEIRGWIDETFAFMG